MDSEPVVKREVARRDDIVLLFMASSILFLSSALLQALLYFSPLILSTVLMCAIALLTIVNSHETENELVDQIHVGESHSTTVLNLRSYATWLLDVDDGSVDGASSRNISSTSQTFDTLPAAINEPIHQSSPEYHASSCDEESVVESQSQKSEVEAELEDFHEEEFLAHEELDVCEDMATQTALDWNSELQKFLIAARNLIKASGKWVPSLSCVTDRALASLRNKHAATREKLTGSLYGVLLLRFQNISVRLHGDSELQHINKVEEDYKQKISLQSKLTTGVDHSCKFESHSGQSDMSLDSTMYGLPEKYNSDHEPSWWMENFASSGEETASECSSDVDSSSLVDLDTTCTSTARNSTHFSESLKEEYSHQVLAEPADITYEASISSEERCFLGSSDDLNCRDQEPNSHASDDATAKEQEETGEQVSRTASGYTVPARIKLEASKAQDPILSVPNLTEEEETSAKDLLPPGQSTSIKISNRPDVKSWPTVQQVLAITRTAESFPYTMRTGNSIASISDHSNPIATSSMAIKIEL